MVNRLDQLIDQFEPRLQKAFTDAIYLIRDHVQIDQVAKMLERADVDGALRAVGLDPNLFREFDKQFEAAYEAGGNFTSNQLPVIKDPEGFLVRFAFAVRNPSAELWLKSYSANLVKEIVDDQRNMIRDFLQAGLSRGANPKTTALDLVGRVVAGKREGGIIGLTTSQEQWVRAYTDELESDLHASLTRALRDKRFDRAVLKAIKDEKPLTADLKSKMITAYRNRALRYRAETIARSETITALHQAQSEALNQAMASGAIRADQITMTWHSAHDNRVREAHRELDGKSIKNGGVFQSSLGPIRFPGDPHASAANTINCRCFLEPSVNFLAGLK